MSNPLDTCPTCGSSERYKLKCNNPWHTPPTPEQYIAIHSQVSEGGKIPTTAEMMQAAEESGKVQQAVIDEYEGGKPDNHIKKSICNCGIGKDHYRTLAPVQAKSETIKLADLIRRVEALENHYHPLEGQIAFSDGKPLGTKDE